MIFVGTLGAAPPGSIEAQVRKFCKDYDIPEGDCTGLIQCAKERSLGKCVKEIAAAAAAGACAAFVHPLTAPICSGIARYLLDGFSRQGMIGGCDLIKARRVNPAANPREALDQLNPGEIFAAGVEDGQIRWFAYSMIVTCVDTSQSDGIHVIGNVEGPLLIDDYPVGIGDEAYSLQTWFYRHPGMWGSTIAVKDWDGNEWVVDRPEQKFVPAEAPTTTTTQYQITPYQVQYVPFTPSPGGYAAGSFAIFDGGLQKYRILSPV